MFTLFLKGENMSYDNNNYTKDLINLQDNTLEISNVSKINSNGQSYFEIHIFKPIEYSNKFCPNCNSNELTIKDYHTRKIKYIPIASTPSFLFYKQRRFKCKDCGKTFNEDCSIVCKNGTISNATKVSIVEEFTKKQSISDIADRTEVSLTTANQTFVNEIIEHRKPLPTIICMDEFKANTIAGKYALILGDPRTGDIIDIIDILPSRKQDYIYYYFRNIPNEERFSVKYIVTDLFESYRTIAKNLFWKSIHIADRFHWIRLATQAFSKVRINTMNIYKRIYDKTGEAEYIQFYEITKKYHKILIANTHKKEIWYFDHLENVYQLKREMTYQQIIEYIVNFDSNLETAYTLLQELYKIAKYSLHDEAKQNILDWCDQVENSDYKLPEFDTVIKTYKSWINEIVNSFIFDPLTKSRITNGFIEGKNNFCKVIKRVGFGYKNFDLFRAKVIYISNNTKDKNKL